MGEAITIPSVVTLVSVFHTVGDTQVAMLLVSLCCVTNVWLTYGKG